MIMSNGSTDAVSGLCNSLDMYRFQGRNPTPRIPPVVAISLSVQNFFSHSVGDSYLIALATESRISLCHISRWLLAVVVSTIPGHLLENLVLWPQYTFVRQLTVQFMHLLVAVTIGLWYCYQQEHCGGSP
jgi:hypothetical protein